MTKPTVTIERCQQIGHQLNLQVTLTCPVPPVYPKLSVVFTCGERTRIIPMAFTDRDGTTLRAQKTVELAYATLQQWQRSFPHIAPLLEEALGYVFQQHAQREVVGELAAAVTMWSDTPDRAVGEITFQLGAEHSYILIPV